MTLLFPNMLFSEDQMEYNESILISQENLIDEETLKQNKLWNSGEVGRCWRRYYENWCVLWRDFSWKYLVVTPVGLPTP